MSSRVLKKLKGRDDELKALATLAQASSEEESDSEHFKPKPSNSFALLGDDDNDDDNNTEPAGQHENHPDELKSENVGGARRKTKKKKKKKSQNEVQDQDVDIDKIVSEIALVEDNSKHKVNGKSFKPSKYILTVEHRFLDPDNELKKIFGTRTVMHNSSHRQRNRNRVTKGTWFSTPSPNWPKLSRTGLSMECIDDASRCRVFKFEHSKEYQKAQFNFLDAVELSDHHQITEVLAAYPYHIDSLLALSEICRVNDDSQTARELLERSLYCMEMSFHSQFNLATGQCRLPYNRPENRCMYLALYRHMHFVVQRGCARTALELSKVLLNLDPDADPLCSLLFIDYFALQSGEYDFLIRFFEEWEAQKNLSQLPNFAYSIAMAHFELAQNGNKDFTMADNRLQDALIRFPTVLTLLFEKCSIQPDKDVVDHNYFTTDAAKTSPDGLVLLCNLFVARNFNLWKTPEILPWLERNVKSVLKRVDEKDPEISKWIQKRRKYQKPPRNIYRYAFICELPGIMSLLPPEIRLEQILSHDPLPPADTIVSYNRQGRRNRHGRDTNAFNLLLNSLNPQYDPNAAVQEEWHGNTARATLHEQFRNLMDAMRDMLGNIQVPLEEEEEEMFREDEWDY